VNELTDRAIGAAIEAHSWRGPGLMESAYEERLCFELSGMGVEFKRLVHLPVRYKDILLDCAYRMDLLVEGKVVVEVKSVESLLPIHAAQLLTYAKCSGVSVGLWINLNETVLKHGLKRVVNQCQGTPPRETPRLRVSALKEETR
jgi:GxxExxY protein